MKLKFFILGLIAVTIAFFAYAKMIKPALFEQNLIKKRALIHDTALNQVKSDFKISDKKWHDFMDIYQDVVNTDDLFAPTSERNSVQNEHELVTLTKQILSEYHVNLNRVKITLNPPINSPAQALQELSNEGIVIHRIDLDPNALKKYSRQAVEGVIRHEVMHLLNYDSLEGSYVTTMLYSCGYSRQDLNNSPAMIAYRQQRESRADLLAACNKPHVAKGLQEFFGSFLKTTDQNNIALWKTHPSDVTRINQLDQLVQSMNSPVVAFA